MSISHLSIISVLCLISASFATDEQISQNDAELYAQFQAFMKFKEQNGEKQEQGQPKKHVIDKNFAIIEKAKDELQKEFDERREILAQSPIDLKMAFELMAKIIGERKAMFQEDGTVESVVQSISEIAKAYDDTMQKIQNIVILLRCFDLITCNSSSIIEMLKRRDNPEIMSQKDAEELWNRIEPALRYSPDDLMLSIKNLFIDVTKSKFEDKPNIPSYYMFHLMSDILEKLKKAHETLNAPAFLRTFENATYAIQKLLSDFDSAIKSDQTAKNTLEFFDGAKKTTMQQLDLIQKRSKEWKEYISSLETLTKRVGEIVKNCVETEKDQSIFDNMANSKQND